MSEPGAQPFRILTVCTGNICRSPMAERLLQVGLDTRFPGQFIVESAGTGALVGNPIEPQVARLISLFGGQADNFFARQLTPQVLEGQDLVLALTREHRSLIVEMSPRMLRSTFTLMELARLLPMTNMDTSLRGADYWRASIPKALRARTANSAGPQDDDVADPYRKAAEAYKLMAEKLAPAIDALVTAT
ncbi:arsenate reductase/protein-tyrosine-phosphatase family protein [Arthrobacter sp. MDT2-2]